jgi:hypothetical protein
VSAGDLSLLKPRRVLEQEASDLDRTLIAPGRASVKGAATPEADDGAHTLLMTWPSDAGDAEIPIGERTLLRTPAARDAGAPGASLSISALAPESAKIYLCLDIEQSGRLMQRIALTEDSAVVGRVDPRQGVKPDIDLTPYDPTTTVSRQHARIYLENSAFYLEDLKSRNTTRLGAQVVSPDKPERLKHGDVVSFGAVKASVLLLGASALPTPWPQS